MTTAVIIQARWTSTRLPGKVLEIIAGRTVLAHVLSRARRIPGADVVVCAIPDGEVNDPIAREAMRCGALVARGSETDVLGRYLGAAHLVNAGIVMRVTSDCPLIDPIVCGEVLALRAASGCDYVSNNIPPTFPHGLDCEAFTTSALAEADSTTREPYDREHVTPWLRRATHLKTANLSASGPPHHEERWTLDYPEDLIFLRNVLERFPAGTDPGMSEVLALLARRPELSAINANWRQPRT